MKESMKAREKFRLDLTLNIYPCEFLEKLEMWYEEILKDVIPQYVVFTDKSYISALMCEITTGKEMKDSKRKKFLTEAAFMLRTKKVAEEYIKYKRLPDILICEDALRTGRRVNHIIDTFENEVIKIVKSNDEKYDEEEIRSKLLQKIKVLICVYRIPSMLMTVPSNKKIIYGEDWDNIHQCEASKELIYRYTIAKRESDIANTCYIYTQHLNRLQMKDVEKNLLEDGFICTTYIDRENILYSKNHYIKDQNNIKAILTLTIKPINDENFRIRPFVFIPNMDLAETNSLIKSIGEKIPAKYVHLLEEWKEISGMRSLNEIITFIFSNVLISEFNRKYNILVDQEDRQSEIIKLARNYNWETFEEAINMLNDLLEYTEKLTIQDLSDILKNCTDRSIMRCPERRDIKNIQNTEINIQKRIEDYFFDRMVEYEGVGEHCCKIICQKKKEWIRKIGRGCAFTIAELSKGYSEQELQYFMSYFLHIVNAGYTSISTDAPTGQEVVGYSQYISPELMVFLAKIKRYWFYGGILSIAEITKKYRFYETRYNKKVKEKEDSIERRIKDFGRYKGIDSNTIQELITFEKDLEKMGQTLIDDWNNFMTLHVIDLGEYNSKRKEKKQLDDECRNYFEPTESYWYEVRSKLNRYLLFEQR